MAGHVGLRAAQKLARNGKPVPSPSTAVSGSLNYHVMRTVTAILEYHRRRDLDNYSKAKRTWLKYEQDQLRVGHWSRAEQCEQLCPQPHSDFHLDAIVDLWLWSLGLMPWQNAREPQSLELAAACEANISRCVASWKPFELDGIVCAPGMRAKDENDDVPTAQWRNRPADKILAIVRGDKGIKYDSPATEGLEKLVHFDPDLRRRLDKAPFPRLRVPVYRAKVDGGYMAFYPDTVDARRAAGKDGLTCVVHRKAGEPEVYYDWETSPTAEGAVDRQWVKLGT